MITRDQIVEYLIDVLGYSLEDTQGSTKAELWQWLTLDQMNEALEYAA